MIVTKNSQGCVTGSARVATLDLLNKLCKFNERKELGNRFESLYFATRSAEFER